MINVKLISPGQGGLVPLNTQLVDGTDLDMAYWRDNFGRIFGGLYYVASYHLDAAMDMTCDVCGQRLKHIFEWRLRGGNNHEITIDGVEYSFLLPDVILSGNVCVGKLTVKTFANVSKIVFGGDGKIVSVHGNPGNFYLVPDDLSVDAHDYAKLMVISRYMCPKNNGKLVDKINAGRAVVTRYATLEEYHRLKDNRRPVTLLRNYRNNPTSKNPADVGAADIICMPIKEVV